MVSTGALLCCLEAAFILPAMKVDSSISHRVLDRIRISEKRLGGAIHHPGEDRCFKGDALGQLIRQEEEPAAVVEPVEHPFALLESNEPEMAPVVVPASSPPLYMADQEELQRLEQEVMVLKESSASIQATLDEIRSEVGKLAANSRREMVRFGKRVEALEQREPAELQERIDPPLLAEVEALQQRVAEIESLSATAEGGDAPSGDWMPHLDRLEVRLNEALEQIEMVSTAQSENREMAQWEERAALILQTLEVVQQTQMEQGAQQESQTEQIGALQQRTAAVQSESDQLRWSELQQRIAVLEQCDREGDSDARSPQLDQLDLRLNGIAEQIEILNADRPEKWEMIAVLQQALEAVQQVQLEQGAQQDGQAGRIEALQKLLQQHTAVSEPAEQDPVQWEALQKQINRLEQALAQRDAEVVPIASIEADTENPFAKSDGREKSIVEELRYEIGEVRKSNSRQLEALNSKLNRVVTSSEVNQMIRHTTQQLQQKMDDMQQKIKQNQQSEQVSTAIRF